MVVGNEMNPGTSKNYGSFTFNHKSKWAGEPGPLAEKDYAEGLFRGSVRVLLARHAGPMSNTNKKTDEISFHSCSFFLFDPSHAKNLPC